jgi:hypothetical protein
MDADLDIIDAISERDNEMEEDDDDYLEEYCLLLLCLQLYAENFNRLNPIPMHTSILTGKIYYNELLVSHPDVFRTVARMDHETFFRLNNFLKLNGELNDSKLICSGEKILILIHVLAGHSIRQTAHRWQHSLSTISVTVHEVANCFMKLKNVLFIAPKVDQVSVEILNRHQRFPYFQNCIGALDGSHIPAVVNVNEQASYRNRKGFLSQNVLAVANFDDITFSYALTGWEGSAHDSKVYENAVQEKGFKNFPDKYYLGDAGYALSWNCLTPYRGTRYHLKEWARGNQRPRNKEELFNLRHASLRNVVERIFGIVKKKISYPC